MTTSTIKSAVSGTWFRLETLFLLSPLAVMLFGMFNFADTKSILSRLIPIVGLYCLWFYRDAIKQNWNQARSRPFLITSILAFLYFGFAHVLRGDEFGYSRTLLTCLAYLVLLPWSQLSRQYLPLLLVVAATVCGLNSMYEFWGMGVHRVGIATNSIPYALFCACLVLASLHQLLNVKAWSWRIVSLIGIGFASTALVLTDVRGVLLFLPFVMAYLVLRILPASPRNYIVGMVAVAALCGSAYAILHDKIEQRLAQTEWEFNQIENGNFNSSIGLRLTLWQGAIETFGQHSIVGAGDAGLRADMSALPVVAARTLAHVHNQFLDTLARYGAVGLIILLAWMVSPLLYSQQSGGIGLKLDPFLSSVILMVVFAGLTDVPFHHTHVVYLFTLLAGAWLMMPSETCEQERSPDT